MKLGRLTRVTDLQSYWRDEAREFTPWLAEEENLALIGETLGFGADWLELIEKEAEVGPFRADIVCQDTAKEEHFVIIENQFGRTDHDHLGKLLTYAAGRKAKTIIWIAEIIRDEHRAAIDLLNDATDDDYQFFALEIELWKIGESETAPRFNVVAKPNDWSRSITRLSRSASQGNLTDLKKTYIEYWSEFKRRLSEQSTLRCQKPSPQQWMYLPIGRSHFTLTAALNSQKSWLMTALEFHGDNGGAFFELMKQDRTVIDAEAEIPLVWEALPGRKGARISVKWEGVSPTDAESWEAQHNWLISKLSTLYDLFHDRVKALDLNDLPGRPNGGGTA